MVRIELNYWCRVFAFPVAVDVSMLSSQWYVDFMFFSIFAVLEVQVVKRNGIG